MSYLNDKKKKKKKKKKIKIKKIADSSPSVAENELDECIFLKDRKSTLRKK